MEGTLPIYAITPFTMLDFPGHTACIIWFTGCNMRCGYCHNPQIVKGKGRGTVEDVMKFLHKRRGLLDGVVLSGGEASSYPALEEFIQKIKDLGYAIKLDTNGLRPDMIREFLEKGFLDYIALDYKAPSHKFKKVTGVEKFEKFSETLDILCSQTHIPFEVRTTVHTGLMNETDVIEIINDLELRKYGGTYSIQNFRADNDRPTLGFLAPQTRPLDMKAIPKAKNFDIQFRNF
ncbi:MAG: anaerobic ribonucleoside-triphosphate reductase activating protein [Pseudobdellovibrionaceae bacterium]|nr:anaerobic ribonucleoside-triphosphate reductase activating protein [Pseudobdellovibrionaceae bacterium]